MTKLHPHLAGTKIARALASRRQALAARTPAAATKPATPTATPLPAPAPARPAGR